MTYYNVTHVQDLEKLDVHDLERGDPLTLHYVSQRKPADADERVVTRDVEYHNHFYAGRGAGLIHVVDGDQDIEADREIRRERGRLYLLSKGGDRVVRLGYLKGITVPTGGGD